MCVFYQKVKALSDRPKELIATTSLAFTSVCCEPGIQWFPYWLETNSNVFRAFIHSAADFVHAVFSALIRVSSHIILKPIWLVKNLHYMIVLFCLPNCLYEATAVRGWVVAFYRVGTMVVDSIHGSIRMIFDQTVLGYIGGLQLHL